MRRLSAQKLADACTKLGFPLDRSVISNFENGRRTTVTVAEVLALAKALDVPPILLIFPVGVDRALDVLPGEGRSTWAAAKWFTGEEPFPTPDATVPEMPADGTETRTLALHREHDQLLQQWQKTARTLHSFREGGIDDDPLINAAAGVVARVERKLAELRHQMLTEGIAVLPQLPATLRHVDYEKGE